MTPKLITERLILREIKGNDLFGYFEIRSDQETMNLVGGPILKNDLESKDFVQQIRFEREKNISYFWTITLKEEKEFIGFVRMISYNSNHFDASFSAIGEYRNNPEFLQYFDRKNGWEIDYALLKSQRKKGIMKEAVGAVLEFCCSKNFNPIYAKVNHMSNEATVSVLVYHNFQQHIPLLDLNLLNKYDHETIIATKQYGMSFIWNN